MPYISNKRPKPKPPQNNVMTISKALKAVNDNMDWTVLFIALLLVMVQQGTACPLSCFVNGKLYFSLSVQCLYEKASKGCHYIYSKCPHSNFTLHRVFILILGYNSSVPFLEEKSATQQCY